MPRSARNMLIAAFVLTLGIIIVVVMKYCNNDRGNVMGCGTVSQEENRAWCGTPSNQVPPITGDSVEVKSVSNGKELFDANCKSCHKIYDKSAGPALRGVTFRHERKWIYAFVRDPGALIQSGDTSAVKIFNEYKSDMTAFPAFTDKDIDDIINYIEYDYSCYR